MLLDSGGEFTQQFMQPDKRPAAQIPVRLLNAGVKIEIEQVRHRVVEDSHSVLPDDGGQNVSGRVHVYRFCFAPENVT